MKNFAEQRNAGKEVFDEQEYLPVRASYFAFELQREGGHATFEDQYNITEGVYPQTYNLEPGQILAQGHIPLISWRNTLKLPQGSVVFTGQLPVISHGNPYILDVTAVKLEGHAPNISHAIYVRCRTEQGRILLRNGKLIYSTKE